MALRRNWKFSFKVADVLAAAEKKLDHHLQRITFWNDQLEKAQRDLKDKGAEFREQPVTGGSHVALVIDPERQNRVNQCASKKNQHQDQANEYTVWVRALRLSEQNAPRSYIDLDAQDIAFFGL